MGKAVSSLYVGLFADVAPFVAPFASARKSAEALTASVGNVGSSLATMTGVAGVAATALGSLFAIGKGFKLAADMEQAQVALETMTGSADVAKGVLKDLTGFAASTPFRLPELVAASKQLIAFGVSTADLMPDLTNLGNLASGVGVPIGQVAEQFGKVAVAGKLTGETLRSFQESGIPIAKALADQFKVPQAAIAKMVEAGQVSFDQLSKAFASMSGPGGQFAGMMAKQSQTVAGLMSTLSDTVDMTLAHVATTIIERFNIRGAIAVLTSGLDAAGGVVAGWVDTVAPYVAGFAGAVVGRFTDLYNLAVPIFVAVGNGIRAAWGPVSAFIADHAGTIKAALGGVAALLAGVSLPAVFGAIGVALAPVAALLAPVAALLGGVSAPALALAAAAGVLVARFDLVGVAGRTLAAVGDYVGARWATMAGVVVNAASAVYSVAATAFAATYSVAAEVWSAVVATVDWAWTALTGAATAGGLTVAGVFDAIGTVARTMLDAVALTFDVVGYAFTHLGDTAELAGVTIAAGVVATANQIGWAFGTAAPAVLAWFGNNWRDIFADGFNYSMTVMANLAANVGQVFTHLPGLIAGTTRWDEVWTPLKTGFQSTLKELPEIPQRVQGELEKSLTAERDSLADAYGNGLGDAIAKRQAAAADATKKITASIAGAFSGGPTPDVPALPALDAVKLPVKPELDPDKLKLDVKANVKADNKIVRSGSAESLARRFAEPPQMRPASTNIGDATKSALAQSAAVEAGVVPAAPRLAPPAPAVAADVPPSHGGRSRPTGYGRDNTTELTDAVQLPNGNFRVKTAGMMAEVDPERMAAIRDKDRANRLKPPSANLADSVNAALAQSSAVEAAVSPVGRPPPQLAATVPPAMAPAPAPARPAANNLADAVAAALAQSSAVESAAAAAARGPVAPAVPAARPTMADVPAVARVAADQPAGGGSTSTTIDVLRTIYLLLQTIERNVRPSATTDTVDFL